MAPKKAKTGASTKASAASKASPAAKKATPVKKATAVASKKKAAPTKKVAATAKKKATVTAPKKAAAAPAKKAAVAPKKAAAAASAKKTATVAPKKPAAAASAKKSATAAPAKKPAAAAPAKKPAANGKKTARATNVGKQGPVTGKRGLSGQAAPDPTNGRVGTVDPAANLSAEAMLAEEERDLELDAMLTQIDVSQNMDKYFILQVICEPPQPTAKRAKAGRGRGQKADSATDKFYFFTRWGRTGTSGSCKLEGPFDELEESSALFRAKFKEKTGNMWDGYVQEDRYLVNAGKYTCLRRNATRVVATPWQYWVDDGVDGKEDGWYDYEDGAAAVVEQLHTEFQTNPTLNQRVVVSGVWTYHVDLSSMTQTNVSLPGRKVRHIRRNPGRSLPNTPPGSSNSKAKNGKNKTSTASAGPVAAPAVAVAPQQTAEVDKHCPKAGDKNVSVCPGHDVKLNQTNISANNNKFYILQMCHDSGRNEWFVWTRWGRVGEVGSSSEVGPFQAANDASTAFKKKFRDKTSNKWEDAQNGQFKAVTGKYELIETDKSDPTAVAAAMASGGISSSSTGPPKKILPCKLDTATKELVELIFSEDMFKSACTDMNIDVRKMPLGQLSKAQVQRGYDVLEELGDALKASGNNRADRLEQLSARFYQVIPHSFGRNRPPVINTAEMLHSKIEMLNVLQDIGEAQSMLSSVEENGKGAAKGKKAAEAVPHPTDVNYGLLNADLELLPPHSNEYGVIKQYLENTKSAYGNFRMYDVWAVDREGEAQRFSAHEKIGNRKLLWHGTNVAVVAAIVKSGLRIMPHSGGRVGRGVYLASENAKSRGYVRPAFGAKGPGINVGVMFLCEAALGKEHSITIDNSSLTSPPDGFDSVVARGVQEPDPSKDTTLTIDGKEVTVPQGKPKAMPAFAASRFSNSEYLVYQESQLRIRYMMTVKT